MANKQISMLPYKDLTQGCSWAKARSDRSAELYIPSWNKAKQAVA